MKFYTLDDKEIGLEAFYLTSPIFKNLVIHEVLLNESKSGFIVLDSFFEETQVLDNKVFFNLETLKQGLEEFKGRVEELDEKGLLGKEYPNFLIYSKAYAYGVEGYKLQAKNDIPEYGVKKGDVSGFVQNPDNISADGWVSEGSFVFDQVKVNGHVANNNVLYNNIVFNKGAVLGDEMVFRGDFIFNPPNQNSKVSLPEVPEHFLWKITHVRQENTTDGVTYKYGIQSKSDHPELEILSSSIKYVGDPGFIAYNELFNQSGQKVKNVLIEKALAVHFGEREDVLSRIPDAAKQILVDKDFNLDNKEVINAFMLDPLGEVHLEYVRSGGLELDEEKYLKADENNNNN